MNDDSLTKVQVIPPATTQVPVSEPPPMDKQAPPAPNQAPPPVNIKAQESKAMPKSKKKRSLTPIILIILVILAGVATGYALSVLKPKGTETTSTGTTTVVDANAVTEGTIYGDKDGKTFPDKAEGVLVKGGIEGEGSHHLMRDGGPSRNVYLTSSVLDLDLYTDHLVEVDGDTFNAQKAGWLMDVGRLKVIKLNAPKPFEEALPKDMLQE